MDGDGAEEVVDLDKEASLSRSCDSVRTKFLDKREAPVRAAKLR